MSDESTGVQSTGQVRVAEEFADRYQGVFMHVDRVGWHLWATSHWRWIPDKAAAAAVQRLLRILLREAVEMPKEKRDSWFRDIRKCESSQGLAGVAAIASGMPGISVAPELVDQQPDLLAFTNGTYELSTDQFRPSAPGDLITKVMACGYDPQATCPTYDRMLAEAQPDPEIRAYLHRQVGAACEGRVRQHMFPVHSGLGGAGKGSTLNDSWLHVFGDYGLAMPVEVLLAGSGKDYMTERLSLKGSRFVVTSEPKEGTRFNGALLKLLAGGDEMSARPLYSNKMIKWKPTHQIFLMCNERPEPNPDDTGVWRRITNVVWMHQVPEDKMDGALPGKLAAEAAGIANRIIDGWKDFRDHGLQIPENCRTETKEWRRSVDYIGQFIDEQLVRHDDDRKRIKSSFLYGRYSSFCKQMNVDAGTQTSFTIRMKTRGYAPQRINGCMWFVGLDFADAIDQ